jgi:hypothetical protein
MSATESMYIQENKERQYNLYLNNGGTMTIEQWENDGRYDRHDWGPVQEFPAVIDNAVKTINEEKE